MARATFYTTTKVRNPQQVALPAEDPYLMPGTPLMHPNQREFTARSNGLEKRAAPSLKETPLFRNGLVLCGIFA